MLASSILFSLVGVIAVLAVRHYIRLRKTPLYVSIPLIIAVYIPLSVMVLLPIDLMSSRTPEGHRSSPFYLSQQVLLTTWRVYYWLAFSLTWAILPLLQGYVESGHYTFQAKIRDSLRQNLRFQLIVLSIGAIGLVYMIISTGLRLTAVKALAMALSHSYALILALWLMAHGLVNVPRRHFLNAQPHRKLRALYLRTPRAHDDVQDARMAYSEVLRDVAGLQAALQASRVPPQYTKWVTEIATVASRSGTPESSVPNSVAAISDEYLCSLARRVRQTRSRLTAAEATWAKTVTDVSALEETLAADGKLQFSRKRTWLPPKVAYFYFRFGDFWWRAVAGVACAAISLLVAFSELTHSTRISVVNAIVAHTAGFGQQAFSMTVLGYMCVAALVSLARVRIFNVYALVPRDSSLSSAIFYASYACRLTVPLSYNYLTLLAVRDSAFETFLGKNINLTPLGQWVNDWLPRLIVVPMAVTGFHLYDRVRDYFGFGVVDWAQYEETGETEELGTGAEAEVVAEAQGIIARELGDYSRYRGELGTLNSAGNGNGGIGGSISGAVSGAANRIFNRSGAASRQHADEPDDLIAESAATQRLLGGGSAAWASGDSSGEIRETLGNTARTFGKFFQQIGGRAKQGVAEVAERVRASRGRPVQLDSDSPDDEMVL